jgi:hypothetical protein
MARQAILTDLPPDQAMLLEQAQQLDETLAALRARFDQYFLGIERKNPIKDLEEFRKKVLKLKTEFIRNTGLKFRVQALYQKFLSYERLWLKSLNEMENGTYSRDLFKLRRKNARRGDKAEKQKPPPEKGKDAKADEKPPERKDIWDLQGDLEADLPDELFEAPKPKAPPLPKPLPRQKTDPALPSEMGGPAVAAPPPLPRQPSKPPAPPPNAVAQPPLPRQPSKPPAPPPSAVGPMPRQPTNPPAMPKPLPRQATLPPPPPMGSVGAPPPRPAPVSATDGLSADKVQRIYDAYITAKKRCKESTDGITMDAVAQTLRKQVPTLMKEHGAKSVDFKVVIKDGKAVLKAVPK